MARLYLAFVLALSAHAAASPSVSIDIAAPGHAGGPCTHYHGIVDTASGDPTFGSIDYGTTGLDVSAKSGLAFWCKGDGGAFQLMLHQLGNTEHNDYRADFTPALGWSYVEIPWSSFAHPGWGTPYDFDYRRLGGITWMALTNGSFDFSVEAPVFMEPKATPTRSIPLSMDALEILDLAAVPNPDPQAIAIHLASPADRVEFKLYSVSGVCVGELQVKTLPAGWSQVPLPSSWSNAPAGLSLLRATASRGASYQVRSKVAKFFVLH